MRARLFGALFLLTAFPTLASITGTVMTREGQPLAGAKVSVYALEAADAQRARLLAASADRTAISSTSTNAKGAFTLESPKDAVVTVRVDAGGYSPVSEEVERDEDSLVFALTAAAPLQGTITANGKPLAGARVAWLGSGEVVSTTDANGHYSVPDPAKWAQRVVIRHPDYAIREEVLTSRNRRDIDFSLDSGVALSGKVMAGDAPAKAAIFVDNWPLAMSDADGSFTVAHAPAKWQLLEAGSGDRVATRAREGKSTTTLKLAPAASVSGSVHNVKQAPVAGAVVALVSGGGGRGGMRVTVASAITDAKGNYSLANVRPAQYQLVVEHPSFTAAPMSVAVTAGARVQKALLATPRARVAGTVVDEDKRAVAAALITAETVSRDPMGLPRGMRRLMAQTGPARPVFSGPDGRFALRTESEGDIELEAAKKGLPTAKSTALHIASGERKAGVTITMPRGIAVTGRVTDAGNKPLSGVAVSASEDEGGPIPGNARRMIVNIMRNLSDDGDVVTTGSDGRFSMRLKEGSYDLNFKREGFAGKNVRAVAVNATTKPVDVTLDPGVEITGRVVRGGNGVEGVNVALVSSEASTNTATGPDGRFTLADLSPGSYTVIFAKQEDFIQQMKTLNAPARDLTIELPPGGRVTGHVVDKNTHEPVKAFQAGVSLARSGGGMVIDMPPQMKSFTSDDGSFVLDNVPVGAVQVVASAPGYTMARQTNITVEEGKTVPDLELALETGVHLTGHVTGPDGSPLAGVVVRPESSAGGAMRMVRQFGGPDGTTTTDANGDYSMDQLEPGQKSFSFSHDGYLAVTKSVDLSGRDARLDAQLSSGTRVNGMVVTDAGAPVADADVRAQSALAGGGFHSARSDAGGNFSIEALAPGHYTFSASKAGYADGTLRDFDISGGAPVRIALKTGGVVYGHVTGVAANDLAHVTVSVRGSNGSSEAAVDNSGNYRVEGAPTGSVRVTAELMRGFGDMRSSEPKSTDLAPGGSVQVDLDFNTATIVRGHVSRNGAPLGNAGVSFIPDGRANAPQVQVSTDDSGNYTASGLSDGSYSVMVLDTQRLNPYSTKYDVHGSGTFDIDIKTAQLRGRVTDAGSGDPVSNARVQIRSKESGVGAFIGMRAATTDDTGSFTFDSISSGTYTVTADKDGYGNDVRDISVSETSAPQLDLSIAKNDGVTLKVVDGRDGQALNPTIVVYDGSGRQVYESMFRGSGASDTTKLTLAPGQYRAVIAAMGYASRTVTIISPSSPTIALTPGGTIEVHAKSTDMSRRARLVDASGAVYARPFSPDATYSVGSSVSTINNVAAGQYRMEILVGGVVVDTKTVIVVDGQTAVVEL